MMCTKEKGVEVAEFKGGGWQSAIYLPHAADPTERESDRQPNQRKMVWWEPVWLLHHNPENVINWRYQSAKRGVGLAIWMLKLILLICLLADLFNCCWEAVGKKAEGNYEMQDVGICLEGRGNKIDSCKCWEKLVLHIIHNSCKREEKLIKRWIFS